MPDAGAATAAPDRFARLRIWAEGTAVFALYSLLGAFYLRPIWRLWRDHLPPNGGDPQFNLYVLEWVVRQLRLGLPDLWGANFFFPMRDALALSDHLLGPAAQDLALQSLGIGPVGAYNLLLLLALALSGTTTWVVLRACGTGRIAAFFGGAVYAFAPYRWDQLSHIQVEISQWVPPLLWTFHRLLARPRWRRAALFLLFYALHVTGGTYLAFLVNVPLLVLLVHRAAAEGGLRRMLGGRRLRVLAPTALVAATLLATILLPYWQASRRLGLVRGADNYRVYGATLTAQLTPASEMPYFPLAERALRPLAPGLEGSLWRAEKALFPGFLPLALAIVGVVALWRSGRPSAPAPALGRSHRAVLAATGAGAAGLFLAADLYTLGWWPASWQRLLGPDRAYLALVVPFLLALALRIGLGRRWTGRWPFALPRAEPWRHTVVWMGAICWLLSFPLLFQPLARVLPGFSSMRDPARLYTFVLFAAACLAAWGLEELLRRRPGGQGRLLGAALCGLLLFELAPEPVGWYRVAAREELPPVYTWLAQPSEVRALVELPLLDDERELPYMWAATRHWKPIVNGFSGYAPPHYRSLHEICCWPVPDDRALAYLRTLGVTHVVIHGRYPRRWQRKALRAWEARAAAGEVPGVQRVYLDELGDRVFEIARPRDGPG